MRQHIATSLPRNRRTSTAVYDTRASCLDDSSAYDCLALARLRGYRESLSSLGHGATWAGRLILVLPVG